jgi:histidinol-phosphatase (PHP family)
MREREAWRVSLHGGHSGDYCDHAEGTLRDILNAAVSAGYHTFGVSEHAPRGEDRFLYDEEIALGWDSVKTEADFARYAATIPLLAQEFADRLIVLRGFEAEVVPTATYADRMKRYREMKQPDGSPVFDYFVGSVHYVDEYQIDGPVENYLKGVEGLGGIEALAVRYYEVITEMIETLRPDVVGHLDLIKKNLKNGGFTPDDLATPRIRAAIENTLEVVRATGAILDLNTAVWRKGLGEPYPAPDLV